MNWGLKILGIALLGMAVASAQARDGRKYVFSSPYRAVPVESSDTLVPVANTQEPPATLPTTLPTQINSTLPSDSQAAPATGTQGDSNIIQVSVPSELGVCKLNSKRLQFNFDVKDVGPSGVKGVEVWCTRDSGKNWEKFNPEIQQTGGFVDVEADGIYGISFVPKTGFGGGQEAPATGDQPQLLLEVDTIKPLVSLIGMQLSSGSRTLRVDWTASDKNLTKRPIVLYYGLDKTGPWVPFTPPLENTGSFIWTIPPGTPNSFWLRVEATDTAGNVGSTESQTAVQIDLSLPAVANIRVLPVHQDKEAAK